MPEVARTHYQVDLAGLEERALDALDLVAQALDRAIEAVQNRDTELAQLVALEDDVLDGRYLEVHQRLLTMIATQAPVASDLRLISALLYVMKNIERMGDQCVNIAKMVPLVGRQPPSDERMENNIAAMGKHVRSLVTQVKQAFRDRNVELARDLVRQDDVVDDLNKECFQIAIEIGDDHDRREWAMTMILAARALERIGDNAVDIGEQVAYVVTGLFQEFEDASHPDDTSLSAPAH